MTNVSMIPIFFAADADYFRHVGAAMVSILENNPSPAFGFHLLTDGDEGPESRKIRSSLEPYENVSIDFHRVDPGIMEPFQNSATRNYISVQTYYRCLLPELFPEIDKAIYLDGDLVVDGDLSGLWTTDVRSHYVAGCVDRSEFTAFHSDKRRLGIDASSPYVNAGVLLMNLKKLREDGMVEKMIVAAREFEDVFVQGDQDILNYTLQNGIKVVDDRYNWTSEHVLRNWARPSGVEPCIHHFTGSVKPWTENRICFHSGKSKYFHYLSKTPWRNPSRPSPSPSTYCTYLIDCLKWYAKAYLPRSIQNALRKMR